MNRHLMNPSAQTAKSRGLLVTAGSLAIAALQLSSLVAQTATPSYLPQKDEAVKLEKVEVSSQRDPKAYSVQRSLTATKTDTALVDVPQAVSVVTRELIDDQAMTGINDLSRYIPGMGIAQGEGNRDTPVMRGNSTTADFFVDGTPKGVAECPRGRQ